MCGVAVVLRCLAIDFNVDLQLRRSTTVHREYRRRDRRCLEARSICVSFRSVSDAVVAYGETIESVLDCKKAMIDAACASVRMQLHARRASEAVSVFFAEGPCR